MSAIGGYFGLEIFGNKDYHPDAIKLNTGRNALAYILKVRQYKKIFLPYYTCDVLMQPINDSKSDIEFYHVDENLDPVFDYLRLKKTDAFIYNNYFGLKDATVLKVSKKCPNLIVDNAQSFFSLPLDEVDTFYSNRKFFGVPDGAYLYCQADSKLELKKDHSSDRFQHLLKRIDEDAEAGYQDYLANEQLLSRQEILLMSDLTRHLMKNINYAEAASKRRENYLYLQNALGSINKVKFILDKDAVPMIYPFYTANGSVREKLIQKRIYTATYWSEVKHMVTIDSVEYDYSMRLIPLPVDQRLDTSQLDTIIKIIKHEH